MRHKLRSTPRGEKFRSLQNACLKNAFITKEGKTVPFFFVQFGFSFSPRSKYRNLDYELEVSARSVKEMSEFV